MNTYAGDARKGEIRKLNSLRGLAALVVVVSHFSNETHLFNGMLGEGAGQLGVMLFFILSGFLMSYLYIERPFQWQEVVGFGTARFARVVPLYLIIVLASYITSAWLQSPVLFDINSAKSLFAHLFLLSGVYVLWTIPTEIQFYVIFVGLWWLFQKRPLLLFWLMALLLVILFFADFPRPTGRIKGVYIDTGIISCLPYFLSGTVFGIIYSRWQATRAQQSAWYLWVLIVIPLLFPQLFKGLFGHENGLWRDIAVLFSVSFVFFSLLFLVPDDHSLLCNKIGDFLGQISYSLYLLHVPILVALSAYFANTNSTPDGHPLWGEILIYFVIFISLSLLSAYASFKLLENPSRRLLKSIKLS